MRTKNWKLVEAVTAAERNAAPAKSAAQNGATKIDEKVRRRMKEMHPEMGVLRGFPGIISLAYYNQIILFVVFCCCSSN